MVLDLYHILEKYTQIVANRSTQAIPSIDIMHSLHCHHVSSILPSISQSWQTKMDGFSVQH